MEQEATYVGIDVWRVDYDESGIASLIAQLQTLNPAAVLLEVTRGIEVPIGELVETTEEVYSSDMRVAQMRRDVFRDEVAQDTLQAIAIT